MRTKTLLAVATIFAAGLASSMAQSNVYSQNVVGYVNLTLTNGLNLVANQLDLDGTGTNNTVYTSVGTNVPSGSRIYTIDTAGAVVFVTYSSATGVWGTAGNLITVNKFMQPGKGFFVQIPGAASYPQTVTLVGNVLQGALSNNVFTAGYQIIASQVPQAGGLVTPLSYTPQSADRVYQFIAGAQGYGTPRTYNSNTGLWQNGEPSLAVGEAIWLNGHVGSKWTRNFTVQ